MRAVIQRVAKSSVTVEEKVTGEIDRGLMVLIGVEEGDNERDAEYIADKVSGLRIFEDDNEKMNLSVRDVGGQLLGDARKGKRPSFTRAASPDEAVRLYRKVIEYMEKQGIHVEEGVFRAHMMVEIYNDGPVTILLDSRKNF